jgi:hypothetical protein
VTARATARAKRDWTVVLVSVAAVALAAVISAVSLHESCFDPLNGIANSSQRAGYCSAVEPTHPWLSLMVLPILVMLGTAFALSSRKWLVYSVAAMLAVALIFDAGIVSGMHGLSSI